VGLRRKSEKIPEVAELEKVAIMFVGLEWAVWQGILRLSNCGKAEERRRINR